MDTALVTGADSGIGLQIARQLIELGYRVYGLAADFGGCSWQHHEFQQITCDLSSTEHLQKAWEHIAKHDPQVDVVVHAYRAPVFAQGFEAAAEQDIAHVVHSGLLAPLLLTRWALPSLIRFRGYVINIGWNGESGCPQGAAAAAVEGGLYHWSQSLFDELRDTGVKVCTVYPQRNPGVADPKARLKLEPQSEVDAKFVARAVAQLLQLRENNLITQLVVRPQGTREEPRIAPSVEPLLGGPKDIVLPDPDKRPPPPTPIPTPERRRPDDAWEFDDEDEDDEFEEDDELDAMLESSRRMLREQNDNARRQLQRSREKDNKRQNERSDKRPDERGGKRTEQPRQQGTSESGKSSNEPRGNRRRDDRAGQRHARSDSDRQDSSAQGSGEEQSSRQHAGDPRPAAHNARAARSEGAAAGVSTERGAEHGTERGNDDQRQERNSAERSSPSPRADGAAESAANAEGEDGKRRRRRRRGGRGRNRNRGEGGAEFDGNNREAGKPAPAEGGAPVQPRHGDSERGETNRRDRFERQPASLEKRQQSQKPLPVEGGANSVTKQSTAGVAEKPAIVRRERPSAPVVDGQTQPQGEKSASAKPATPAAAKPVRPAADKPARGAAEKPAASASKKTAEKVEPAQKAATKKAATKKAAVKKTAVKKAATKKAAVKKTVAKKAAGSAAKKSDTATAAGE